MTVAAFEGPLVSYGSRSPLGQGGSNNADLGPSVFYGGSGFIDPRGGYNVTKYGLYMTGGGESAMINQVPSAIAANNIAASQAATAGTPLTLVSSSGAGITVLASALVVPPALNTIAVGTLAIDGAPAIINFGLAQVSSGKAKVAGYDPTTMLARNVRVTSAGNDSAGFFTVAGYDVYGYPQTEKITGANVGVASGKKSFKFVSSVTPGGTISGSNVQVGTGDVYGFPMLSSFWGDTDIVWNNSWITTNTGYLAADTTSPATNVTGDVRGTYAVQSASDGTKRLMVFCSPSLNNIALGTVGMFGVTPA